jgi:hypothetical protein
MKALLEALKGAKVLARGTTEQGEEVIHYLLPNHRVLEVVRAVA